MSFLLSLWTSIKLFVGTWVLSRYDFRAVPKTVQTASPVCGSVLGAGYPHAVAHAASSSRREAVASRRAASRFKRVRLQCRAPLDDGVIEQFEHQAKGRQFLFLDGAVIVAFERFS